MRRSLPLAAALCVLLIPRVLAAQSFTPKTIEFHGAPTFPDADLLAAAQLHPGQPLTMDQVRTHAQLLLDTGLFDDIHYNFAGPALVFTLTPSTQVFPMRLVNLPIAPGPDLDAKLHALFPLYHGKVPADGTLLSGIRAALEQMLAAQGLQTTVKVVPFTDPKVQAITSMDFSIYIPDVLIGAIQLDAPQITPQAATALRDIASKLTGQPYDREGSRDLIQTSLQVDCRNRGFLDCAVHAAPQPAVQTTLDQLRRPIHIPFSASIVPGPLYRLSSIQLAPGVTVPQADFDRLSGLHPGDPADLTRIQQALDALTRQYHDTGHVRAQSTLAPAIDRAHSTVAYTVNVDPGPVYTMGRLAIENVSGNLRGMILATWKMAPGSVFDESAIMDYFSDRKLPSDLKRTFATATIRYILHIDDATKTVGVEIILQKKQ